MFQCASLARWITGPSATGSLKGTPNSITSAPAEIAASATSPSYPQVRIAAGKVGDESGLSMEVSGMLGSELI